MRLKPALNAPAQPVAKGARPYEMEGRKEDRVPLVGFEDLTGWTIEQQKGAVADLIRTDEQQLWGSYVAKLAYKGKAADSAVILRPPAPIPIPGAFDSISFWIYGNNWAWEIDRGLGVLGRAASGRDQAGDEGS